MFKRDHELQFRFIAELAAASEFDSRRRKIVVALIDFLSAISPRVHHGRFTADTQGIPCLSTAAGKREKG